uniref:Uncharacterized protein n=1 Tax=Rhizophora mucronata TaxID=61149 RepID=A0A2P2LE98_RHIMU
MKVDDKRHRISLGTKDIDNTDDAGILPSAEESDEEFPVLAQAKSRAFIPPLEVNLYDLEQYHVDDVTSQSQEHVDGADTGVIRRRDMPRRKKGAEAILWFSFTVSFLFSVI